MTGHAAAARKSSAKALAGFEALGDPRGQASVLRDMAYDPTLNVAERDRTIERALTLAVDANDRKLLADLEILSGDAAFGHGRFEAAADQYGRAIAMSEEVGDKDELARALTSLGRLQRAHGHSDVALTLFQRALALAGGDRRSAGRHSEYQRHSGRAGRGRASSRGDREL